MRVLERSRLGSGGKIFVFASTRSKDEEKPMGETTVSHAIRRIIPDLGTEDFTSHDLRRTAATHMAAMGVPRLVIAKILNHADQAVTAIYDRHSYDKEKREALDAWGEKLEGLVNWEKESLLDVNYLGQSCCRN
jgi:integrase